MGAFSLLPPGRRCGPCDTKCSHVTCETAHRLAERLCLVCGDAPGYAVAIYAYPERHGQADCIDFAHEDATNDFIDGLAELMAAKHLGVEPRLPISGEGRGSKGRDEPEPTHRYVLPEFDIDIEIPAGRGGKQRYRATAQVGGHHRATKKSENG